MEYWRRRQVRKRESKMARQFSRFAKLLFSSTSFLLNAHTHNRFPAKKEYTTHI